MADSPGEGEIDMTELREEASRLAGALPGELRRLHLKSDGKAAEVEVEWQQTAASTPEKVQAPAVAAETTSGPDQVLVTSPMVGTFFRAPEPGADPFVSVGDEIDAEQVIGIVEAMKLMNPIPAEVAGRVVEILCDNAEPVEFGRPLVAIAPAGQAPAGRSGTPET